MLKESFIVLDFETTGLSPNYDRIIEFGAIKVENGEIVDSFEQLIYPEKTISPIITSITGITNEMLKNAPLAIDLMPKLDKFIGNNIIIAHNASFDANFLKAEMERASIYKERQFLCTLLLSRRLYQDLHSHKLETLCRHLNIQNTKAHRALSDVYATREVFKELCHKTIKQSKRNTLSSSYMQELSKIPKKKVYDFLSNK